MGRKILTEEIFNGAKADGYIYVAHQEDIKSKNTVFVPKTIRDQMSVLYEY